VKAKSKQIVPPAGSKLEQYAGRIRALVVDVAKDSLALGRELDKAFKYWKTIPKPERPSTWKEWLGREFGSQEGFDSRKRSRFTISSTSSSSLALVCGSVRACVA
jgi:hypothetical protein